MLRIYLVGFLKAIDVYIVKSKILLQKQSLAFSVTGNPDLHFSCIGVKA